MSAKQSEGPRSFCTMLRTLLDGDAERDLSKEHHELVKGLFEEAVNQNRGLKGTLTLKMTFEVDPKGQCEIGYQVTTKEPTPQRAKSNVWVDKGGNVVFEPPRQLKLGLHEVPKDPAPIDANESANAE